MGVVGGGWEEEEGAESGSVVGRRGWEEGGRNIAHEENRGSCVLASLYSEHAWPRL